MPAHAKRNSVLCLGLALLFSWAFMFAKHDSALGAIIPFGDDPYDAVGSFGIFVAMVVAIIALVRAFRPYRTPPSPTHALHLIRAQTTVILVVWITLGTDAIAMARHPAMWAHAAALPELLGLLVGLALAAVVAWLLVKRSHRPVSSASRNWPITTGVAVAAAAVLAFYPERLVAGITTHLLTVVIAALILFATTRALLVALVPEVATTELETAAARRRFGPLARWGIVTIIGAAFGTFALLGELTEGGGGQPIARVLALAAVFLGLAIAGLLIAFSFLGPPLGFGGNRRRPRQPTA